MNNRPRQLLTLGLIYEDGKVLLGYKKRGFGEGWWNGFGGKVKEGELLEEAAKREILEESGLVVEAMKEVTVLEFEFRGQEEIKEVHIFRVTKFSGELMETEEMRPGWFTENNLPFNQMWPADRFWPPLFLAEKTFQGRVLFDEEKRVLAHKFQEND